MSKKCNYLTNTMEQRSLSSFNCSRNFPSFIESKMMQCPQQNATGPDLRPGESSLHLCIHFLWSTSILFHHLCQVVSSFPVFKLKYCIFASPPLYVTYALTFFNETELEKLIPFQHTCSSVKRNSWHHHRWWRHHP